MITEFKKSNRTKTSDRAGRFNTDLIRFRIQTDCDTEAKLKHKHRHGLFHPQTLEWGSQVKNRAV